MRRKTRITAAVTILISIVIALSTLSCGVGVSTQLDGTWNLVTTIELDGTKDVWNGTYDIELTSEFEINDIVYEFYRGEIMWDEVSYIIRVERRIGVEAGEYDYILNLYKSDENYVDDSIKMLGYLSGYSSASGYYIGLGSYGGASEYGGPEPPDGDWGGTFHTTKQE